MPELPVNCIALDPEKEGHIYIGTDSGIFFTANSGGEWISFNHGIPNIPVTSLIIHNPTRRLITGTYGASAYSIVLNDYLPGDVNLDSEVNIQDIIITIQFILGNIDLTEQQLELADINEDEILNVLDIVLVANLILSP